MTPKILIRHRKLCGSTPSGGWRQRWGWVVGNGCQTADTQWRSRGNLRGFQKLFGTYMYCYIVMVGDIIIWITLYCFLYVDDFWIIEVFKIRSMSNSFFIKQINVRLKFVFWTEYHSCQIWSLILYSAKKILLFYTPGKKLITFNETVCY